MNITTAQSILENDLVIAYLNLYMYTYARTTSTIAEPLKTF